MGLVFLGRTLMHWRAARFFFRFVVRINSLAPTLRYVTVTGRKPANSVP